MKIMSGAMIAKPDGNFRTSREILEHLADARITYEQRRIQFSPLGTYQDIFCQVYDALAREIGYNLPTAEEFIAKREMVKQVKITLS